MNNREKSVNQEEYHLRAGTVKREITTQEKEAHVLDPLYVKVLLLDDGKTQVAIISMDVLAIGGIGDLSDAFLPKLRERIEKELGIPAQHILVNASHTHPPGQILRAENEVIKSTFDAVSEALQNRIPVKIGWGSGHEDRISMNRNLTMKNGKHWTIRHANPCPPDEDAVSIGPMDPEIGVIRVDRLDGTPLAVVYNFAVHLLFADPQTSVSAMIPGVASGIIEETLGNGALALFLQGAAGDIIDVGFKDFNRPREIETYGNRLGLSTLEAIKKIQTADAEINVITETIALPRRTDIPERIAALEAEQTELLESLRDTSLNFRTFLPLYLQYALNARFPGNYSYAYLQAEKIQDQTPRGMDIVARGKIVKYLQNIQAMERLALIREDIATLQKHQAINAESGESTIAAEVMGVKIGECVLITAPIEILTEVALNIKKSSPYKSTFMAAFTNGYMHYGAPASYYDKVGYEVTECLLAPEWEKLYTATAEDIIRKL
jgi:hypothetical protein